MIPFWALSGLSAAAIAGFAGYKLGHGVEELYLRDQQVKWGNERAQAANETIEWQTKARAAESRERDKERMWNDIARSIDADGTKTADKLRTAVIRSDAVGVGLHSQLASIVAESARVAEASASAADARERQAAAQTTRMLANVYGECERTNRARNLFADQASDAGQACQRWAVSLEAEVK